MSTMTMQTTNTNFKPQTTSHRQASDRRKPGVFSKWKWKCQVPSAKCQVPQMANWSAKCEVRSANVKCQKCQSQMQMPSACCCCWMEMRSLYFFIQMRIRADTHLLNLSCVPWHVAVWKVSVSRGFVFVFWLCFVFVLLCFCFCFFSIGTAAEPPVCVSRN